MDKAAFLSCLRRWQRGSISRRHFLGATGLGVASALLARGLGLPPRPAFAQGDYGGRVGLGTWPDYHDPANLAAFTARTGAAVEVTVFGSNEEMMARVRAGGAGYDVIVPSNHTIRDYVRQGLLLPLDPARLPAYDPAAQDARFLAEGTVDGILYAVPKNWGTTGYVIDSAVVTEKPTSWKDFWDLTMTRHSGQVVVHDDQITTVGAALKSLGYAFNSVDPGELAEAEALLLAAKPHLFAISSDYGPAMLSGDAVMSICWTGEALRLRREKETMVYVLGREGGEIWADFYGVPGDAPNPAGGHALIDFLLAPEVNLREVLHHGYASSDARTRALLPKALLEDPILYPAAELLAPLEFCAAGLVANEARIALFARFKSA